MAQSFRGIRYLHILGLIGAGYIGWISHDTSRSPWDRIFVWWLAIFCAAAVTTSLSIRFARREQPNEALRRWALAKTLAAGFEGFSWSLGPILLYVPNEPGSVMIPVGGIVNSMAATVTVGASYTPAMVLALLCELLPAGSTMVGIGGPFEIDIAICLFGALPFMLMLGGYASREVGAAIEQRFRIADLLSIQTRQTLEIREAQRERNRFFSAASHDLRQPLHALGLYLSLLRGKSGDKDDDDVQARLIECATSLDRQFNAILGVAETDSEIANAAVASAPLQVSMLRVLSIFEPEAQRRGLRLRLRPTPLWARISPQVFERVLANLVSNAIKYTHRGDVLVVARRVGALARLCVYDTGIGIAPKFHDRIFSDFFQIGNPERSRHKGSGLGLAIVQRLCAGMGWRMGLRSRLGHGSQFYFDVPLAEVAGSFAETIEPAPEAEMSRGDASVLIVDDDPLVRDAMHKLLATWGLEATIVSGGREAIDVIRAGDPQRPWRALVDYRLPGEFDGLALADHVEAEFGQRVKGMLMTGETNADVLTGAKARGLTLLQKPLKPIRLRACLSAD